MKAAIVYDSGTHTTKKMKSWADVFVAYFQRGIKRNIVPRLGIEIEHFIVSHDTDSRLSTGELCGQFAIDSQDALSAAGRALLPKRETGEGK